MRRLSLPAALLLLASCQDPGGQCSADADCVTGQVCGADGLCVVGIPETPGAPVANDDPYAFDGAGPFQVAAPGVLSNDTGPAGATLTATLDAGPTYGQLFLAADGSFTYAPYRGHPGADAFTYRAHNGTTASKDVATVSITVTNPPP